MKKITDPSMQRLLAGVKEFRANEKLGSSGKKLDAVKEVDPAFKSRLRFGPRRLTTWTDVERRMSIVDAQKIAQAELAAALTDEGASICLSCPKRATHQERHFDRDTKVYTWSCINANHVGAVCPDEHEVMEVRGSESILTIKRMTPKEYEAYKANEEGRGYIYHKSFDQNWWTADPQEVRLNAMPGGSPIGSMSSVNKTQAINHVIEEALSDEELALLEEALDPDRPEGTGLETW